MANPALAPAWRTLREPKLRVLAVMLALSMLAHVVLTPLAGLWQVLAALSAPPAADDGQAEQLRFIPVTLFEAEEFEAAPKPAPEASPHEPVVQAPAQRPEPRPPPAKPKPPAAKPSAPAAAPSRSPAPEPAAKRGEIGHPVAMAGVTSQVVDSNANVNLLLLSERVREHPLGQRIGRLLTHFPQWSSFFEAAEIDPVRDINRILIVGPQFRRSADVVAILQHGMQPAVVRGAVDRLVRRPPRGRWLEAKVPAARAYADRAERLFALTAPDVLVVAPPHLQASLLAAPPTRFPTPKGDEALVLHVKTPWRALIGLPFTLPRSLAWLRLDVLPLASGGAQLRVSAEDDSPRLAAEHARTLTTALNAVTNPDLGALGALIGLRSIAFIDKVQLQANGKLISGQVVVTPRQLDRLLTYAEQMFVDWRRELRSAPAVDAKRGAPRSGAGAGPSRSGENPTSATRKH